MRPSRPSPFFGLSWTEILIIFCIVGILATIPFTIIQDRKDRRECEARGGTYYAPYKSQAICLKSANVLIQ